MTSDEVERVLRENGLTDKPADYGDGIHSWRCEYPDVYGPCTCFAELRDELVVVLSSEFATRCGHGQSPARCLPCLNDYIDTEATLAELEENL